MAGRSVVVERVAGVGIAVHPGEIGRGCAQLLDALRRDTGIEVAVVTEPRDLQLRCKFGACGNPISSGFCNAATVVRDSGIDEGYGGTPQGCGAAHAESEGADFVCSLGSAVVDGGTYVVADACAVECHERILRGREVGEGGLCAAVVEMRGDGKVAGIGEAFEDALDVLVHAPRFLENYYRMSRFTRRIRSADGQRYITCGRRESSHVPTVCEPSL